MKTFETLQESLPSTSAIQLEHPSVTRLHIRLVQEGSFDGAEELLADIAYPVALDGSREECAASLLDLYCQTTVPQVHWSRLDSLPGTATWDGEYPSPRGGHQMILVRPAATAGAPRSEYDTAESTSHLYLFGGWNGETELADLWRFDLQEQRWELLSADTSGDIALAPDGARIFGPDPRSCHQMAVDQDTGDVYMLGRFVDAHAAARQASTVVRDDDARMDTGLDAQEQVDIPYRAASSSVHSNSEGMMPPVMPRSRDHSDFWVLHTRGPLSGTWEMVSENVEVSRVGTLWASTLPC